MVTRAIKLLELQATDKVLDLFCGLGNFTLPIATKAQRVVGVEGSEDMVSRAKENALRNKIENASFFAQDLSADTFDPAWFEQRYDKLLIDPPRSGAQEIICALAPLRIPKIVYISCNPATLARDTEILVSQFGYKLKSAGILDMFPQTAHVESMAVFDLV
jgi:23S rRNA (uracil1939-C5)-methyltransferase